MLVRTALFAVLFPCICHADLFSFSLLFPRLRHFPSDNEPSPELVAQLAQEVYSADLLPLLAQNLGKLEFEAKKDVAQIFSHLLRRQIGTRSPTVEYLVTREQVLSDLVKGCVHCWPKATCLSLLYLTCCACRCLDMRTLILLLTAA